MTRTIPILICAFASVFAGASPLIAQETMTPGPAASDGEAVGRWVSQRVARARAGHRDTVRLPLVFPSEGWGCICPDHYIGSDPNAHAGGDTWLKIENHSGAEFPAIPTRTMDDFNGGHYEASEGMVVRVDGYFTGDVERINLEGQRFNVVVFRVTRIHNRMLRAERARVALVRTSEVGVCERVVQGDSPLNIRSRPRSQSDVVGTLSNGTRVRPVEWSGDRWIRIEGSVAGWVWVDGTQRACDPPPAERSTP